MDRIPDPLSFDGFIETSCYNVADLLGIPPELIDESPPCDSCSITREAIRQFRPFSWPSVHLVPVAIMAEHKQVRFPRSKKARIRKKWRKNPKNWVDIPSDDVLRARILGCDVVYGHPKTLERLHGLVEPTREPLEGYEVNA